MTTSAAQAAAFFAEVAESGQVWTLRDSGGHPAPEADGVRVMPFWSKESRAARIVDRVAAYAAFEIVAIPLHEWRDRWLPGLERDCLRVGLNWAGERATGYDLEPAVVMRRLLTNAG
ncbi:DUF2750 domain-containing protein [Intrasporangium sp. YIM S08009]|uniref:DUF2750 domain-containing protein n=1 Tax=Intrasporangium zincisolvens TaxID=3080018 RepID=UPI002B05E166|nr:DUF2750 domain-containing protein [Intrasporangium sp. YIM S08009]